MQFRAGLESAPMLKGAAEASVIFVSLSPNFPSMVWTWFPHVDLCFSKLISTKCFSNVAVRTEKMSCRSCNSDNSQPTGMMYQWFLQHCPEPNCPMLCIEASHSCADCCTWNTRTHMLSLDHARNFCSRNALISCLVPPHNHR